MAHGCLQGHQGEELHDDWIWPFRLFVRREWTAFCHRILWGLLDFSRPPRYLWGNLDADVPGHFDLYDREGFIKVQYPNDIPPDGHWFVGWPPYWAWTQKTRDSRRLWRLGLRYTETTAGKPTWAKTPEHNYYNTAGPAIRDLSPDLAFALSRTQLRNHLVHGAIAVILTLFMLVFELPGWAVGLLTVAAVAFGKEYFEVMRRLRRSLPIHWWDGILDAAGWLFFTSVTILVWRALR